MAILVNEHDALCLQRTLNSTNGLGRSRQFNPRCFNSLDCAKADGRCIREFLLSQP
jgi:hypothetical protein